MHNDPSANTGADPNPDDHQAQPQELNYPAGDNPGILLEEEMSDEGSDELSTTCESSDDNQESWEEEEEFIQEELDIPGCLACLSSDD